MYTFLTLALSFCLVTAASAQTNTGLIYDKDDTWPVVRELNWLNQQFLIKQRKRVEEITRKNFGRSLASRGNKALLQRIIDKELLKRDQKLELQALGVVLGDEFVLYNKALIWQVFQDEQGSSHAVCVKDTKHCLFPTTMLSRRMEAGIKPKVEEVYQKGISAIKEFLPKLPYSRD